jgi:hypothetical protein
MAGIARTRRDYLGIVRARDINKVIDYVNDLLGGSGDIADLTATAAEINRAADVSARRVNATAATLTVTQALHEGRTITLNRADGIAVTLPAATGSGSKYRFVVGTAITTPTTIKVVGNDIMAGVAIQGSDAGAGTSNLWATAADSDTITLTGTTTGGFVGDVVELEDIAADTWAVKITGNGSGTEATPFSATVS